LSVDKALESVYAAPFWIGFFVTFIAALTASGAIAHVKNSFGEELSQAIRAELSEEIGAERSEALGAALSEAKRNRLQQVLTRDFDAVQSVVGIVSVIASALLLVHLSSVEGAIAFAAGTALIVAVLSTFPRTSPAWYSSWSKGAFTPVVDLLLFLNLLGLALVALLHLRLPS
jgi:hypothetical protein